MRDDRTPMLVCRLSGCLVGLPLAHVVETMRSLAIEPMATSAAFIKGVSVIRGAPTPVVDPGRLLGPLDTAASRFVTVRAGSRTVALAFEDVIGVRTIANASVRALPPLLEHAGADAVAALGVLDAELLVVLDAARVVPELVREIVGEAGPPA